ncbi:MULTISPECIES: YaaA family protein [Actinomadura]|uniref:Peroxide stress protein YaaA n=1 Tax=Actinomadura litoris TaxID=2678616 RepID=A0A7K1KUS2_9ACTN|nr:MULTISPECIES: peroxide stress protein YaaA [Actinomadura]MBT2211004.1 peroxide stress protein YaaA [Actinomadura sp. NEAU-AAG7]MUN35928.1 peroxide stress protein YaaA [Actinomadura litoris]
MHILLPPSEKKAAEGDGPPLDLASLSFPGLNPVRRRVLAALGKAGRRADAAEILEIPAGQVRDALARNKILRKAPTLPAARLYTGVLYDNLDLPSLDAEAAADRIIVFSGLWGALRLTDRVPPYRLAMAVSLPPEGRLSALWRPAMGAALNLEDPRARRAPRERPAGGPPARLIVDMRSGPYASVWKAPGPAVAVRVFREAVVDGVPKRTVVSHMAKATRGRIAHDLIRSGASPGTPDELLKTVADLGHTVELNGANLDVILHD